MLGQGWGKWWGVLNAGDKQVKQKNLEEENKGKSGGENIFSYNGENIFSYNHKIVVVALHATTGGRACACGAVECTGIRTQLRLLLL